MSTIASATQPAEPTIEYAVDNLPKFYTKSYEQALERHILQNNTLIRIFKCRMDYAGMDSDYDKWLYFYEFHSTREVALKYNLKYLQWLKARP
jgi:hypothetical protein